MEEDKTYVLCEFVNEDLKNNDDETDRPVQVAHADWLIFNGPNIPICTLIQEEREIVVKWPENYDVQPKEIMAKILTDIKWINTVAVLKAQSNEWAEIVEASKNIIKYGVPFPSKQQRKELAKKKDIDDINSDSKKLLKPLGEKKRLAQNKRDDKHFVTVKTVRDKEFILKDDDFFDSVGSSLSKKKGINMIAKTADVEIIQQKRKKKEKQTNIIFSSSNESGEESEEKNKLSKSQLLSKVSILEAEVKRLRNDLKLYKTMHVIVEEFPRLK